MIFLITQTTTTSDYVVKSKVWTHCVENDMVRNRQRHGAVDNFEKNLCPALGHNVFFLL